MRFEKWQALGNDYLIVERDALPVALTPGACGGCATPHRLGADGVLELGRPTRPASWPGCGSSTPTARRPSCRATARARPSCTCAARAGPTAAVLDPDRRRARSARRSLRRRPAAWTWAARGCVDGSPRAADGRHVEVGGLALPARARRQPPVRDPRRRPERAGGARPAAIGPASSTTRCSRTAPTCRLVASWAGTHPRADLRARGGGDAGLGHRGLRRGGRARPARRRLARDRPARRRRARRGRRRGLHVDLDGLGGAGLRAASSSAELVAELRAAAASASVPGA